MRRLSTEFKQLLAENKHNYLVYADITLQDSTVLNLTNQHIWNGGFIVENAVSEDDNFTALGSVIIDSAELVINNIDESFSAYDFTNANVVLRIGLQLTENIETITLGTFTVDDAQYNGGTIRLYMLDYIEQFDRPYSLCRANGGGIAITYPATLQQIARNACLNCGVTLATASIPNGSYTVNTRPNDESITFREVMSWIATIAGCYVQARYDGWIEFKWFDTTALDDYTSTDLTFNPWNDDVALDGGTFNPWNTGDVADGGTFNDGKRSNVNRVSSLYSQNIATDDVVITGVTIAVKDESDTSTDNIKYYKRGTSGYVIEVSDNPFITTSTGQTVVNYLGSKLIGCRFRKLNITHTTDPAIEVGDFVIVKDRKNNVYYTLVTRVTFSADDNQTLVCGASTPLRNSATRYSNQTKSYVESRKLLKAEMTEVDQALQDLTTSIASKSGLYTTPVPGSSGTIYYLHDKPNLADSKKVWKMTSDAWAVTTDYKGSDAATTWTAGVTVNGTVIARILSTDGVNANWIKTGTLDAGRVTVANLSASVIRTGSMSASLIQTGTMSADRISGGVMKLGGANNTNGTLEIYNSSGTKSGQIDATSFGIYNNGNVASYATTTGFTWGAALLSGGAVSVGAHNGTTTPSNIKQYGKLSLTDVESAVLQDEEYPVVHLGYVEDLWGSSALTFGEWKGSSLQTADVYAAIQRTGVVTSSDETEPAGFHWSPVYVKKRTAFDTNVYVRGTIYCLNAKPRVVETADYGTRVNYCYETTSPCFGDIGTGMTDGNGECYVFIDEIFKETINTDHEYNVFLQKEGPGDIWVSEKAKDYFVVKGTPDLSFSWELKTKQFDHANTRMEELLDNEQEYPEPDWDDGYADIDYAEEGAQYVEDYIKELEGIA